MFNVETCANNEQPEICTYIYVLNQLKQGVNVLKATSNDRGGAQWKKKKKIFCCWTALKMTSQIYETPLWTDRTIFFQFFFQSALLCLLTISTFPHNRIQFLNFGFPLFNIENTAKCEWLQLTSEHCRHALANVSIDRYHCHRFSYKSSILTVHRPSHDLWLHVGSTRLTCWTLCRIFDSGRSLLAYGTQCAYSDTIAGCTTYGNSGNGISYRPYAPSSERTDLMLV